MTSPETSYDNIRLKIAGLIQNKLFHPGKDNAELAKLSEEFTDLWFAWVAAGEIEPGVNDWLPKLKLSHTGFWLDPEPVCRRTSQSMPRSSELMTAHSFLGCSSRRLGGTCRNQSRRCSGRYQWPRH